MLELVNYEGKKVLPNDKHDFILWNLQIPIGSIEKRYTDNFEGHADYNADYQYVAYDGFQLWLSAA